MNDFIRKYEDQLHGKLSGFDRLVFRGTLWKNALTGMSGYLWAHHLGAKDFGVHAAEVSQRVKEASLAAPLASGRPIHYLNSGKQDKQQIALQIAARDRIRQGSICVLSAVELCRSYAVKRSAVTQRPDVPQWRATAPAGSAFVALGRGSAIESGHFAFYGEKGHSSR